MGRDSLTGPPDSLTESSVGGVSDAELTAALALKQPLALEGTKATMPVANTVPVKTMYFATDENGGTCYRSDGVTSTASPAGWTKVSPGVLETGGREVSNGYAEITSNSFVTGVTRGPGTNPLALNGAVVGSRPVALIFDAAAMQQSTDQGIGLLYFSRSPAGAGTWTDIGYMHAYVAATSGRVPAHRELRQSLAPGNYDFKLEMVTGNAVQTVTVVASAPGAGQPGPASLSLVER